MQVPSLLVIAHDMHLPVQVVAQQTPCWQWLDWQAASAAQLAPGGLSPQLPLLQVFPVEQSPSTVQTVLHVPALAPLVLHMYGTHGWLGWALQVPIPSQRPAKVSVDPVQPDVPQATPAT
jgi:hypothetical protein